MSGFDQTYSGCCTITLTNDNGGTFGGGYGYKAYVRDVNNASPQFTSPPIWYIMDGCAGQTYHVNPVDPEADTVRCRWSTSSESHAMAWTSNLQQFSLDEENCIVTYHPEKDLTGRGSKPVAVQVEDFDANGNLLHSVPLGFVGVVFTPQIEASRRFQKKNPLYAGLIEGTDEHDEYHDHDHDGRRRRSIDYFSPALLNPEEITSISRSIRSTEPDHCLGRPSFSGESPEQGSEQVEVWVPGLKIEVGWEVSYSVGGVTFYDVPRYQFSRPNGMTCTAFNSSGKAVCTWFPTAAQAAQGEHPHCVVVYDRFGRASDRQCVTLRVYPPCDEGEVREGSVCVDADECADGSHTCASNEVCTDIIGSFSCSCAPGWEGSAGSCGDVDECSDGTHICSNTEVCTNTPGSYNCDTCKTGFVRDGASCIDEDECAEADACGANENCSNTYGSFTCSCVDGYARDASSGLCTDINECIAGTHTCATTIETCVNTAGSFECACSSGYERNSNGVCVDIDECARGTDSCAATIETCVNNIGSFTCPCSTGYERDSNGVCIDIDECVRGTDSCADVIETCINSIGSFNCPCSSGYERDINGTCIDIDECAREIDTCHDTKERCDNYPGTYECVCLPMPFNEAMETIEEWIDVTSDVLAKHGRAYKFEVRMSKLTRNALHSYDVNCTTAYNEDKIGKNEFAIWEKQATLSEDVCVQATTIKTGLNAWVDNYACMDKKNSRETKRVAKFIEKVTNPYC